MNNIELFLSELGRAFMQPKELTYNGILESESSETYRIKIESLYSNAISDLYKLSDAQRGITISRIGEVRECQESFDIPTKEAVGALLSDYNAQPEGRRNKTLLDDYRYCKFVLECVAIQKEYLERFALLVMTNKTQEVLHNTIIENSPDADAPTAEMEMADSEWLTVDDVVAIFKLPKNNIKSRKWRIEHDFPYKGFDEGKEPYAKVVFYSKDVENWIKNHNHNRN